LPRFLPRIAACSACRVDTIFASTSYHFSVGCSYTYPRKHSSFHLRFVGINFYRSLGSSRSTLGQTNGGPERWIRELEEETGAVCIRKMGNIGTSSPGAASSAIDAGPSNLTARGAGMTPAVDSLLEDGRKVLPNFILGSYEEMLRTCKKEARIGCVILVSEEHDDVPAFKRYTLENLCP
jgi:FAS-associated factor 2